MSDSGRKAEVAVELNATLEEAWRVISEAEELMRWFPLEAEVRPGVGGSMRWGWGDSFSGIARIESWEPPHLLRLVQEDQRPYDADGRVLPAGEAEPARLVVEMKLETRAGKTVLRLIHSGFGQGAAWDDELEGVSNGWQFELRSLAHYVSRHLGHDRHIGWAIGKTTLSHAAVWQGLRGVGGYTVEAESMQAGRAFTLRTPSGRTFSGTVMLHVPEREFAGTVRELGDGIIRLGTWRAGGETGIHVWAATWNRQYAGLAAEFGREGEKLLVEKGWKAGSEE